MIYIENTCADPYYNLAFEEYVFQNIRCNDTILLLWQNRPSVIIGRYQNTAEEISAEFIKEKNINVVRRITGGGAVYHDLGNLNYSFIVPAIKCDIDFKTFTKPLVAALEKLNIHVEQSGRNDLTINGKKFSGNAQYYANNVLLHHGTILFNSKLDDVQLALKVKPGKIESKGIKSVRSRVTNISPYLPEPMTIKQFKTFLIKTFSEMGGLNFYKLSAKDEEQIQSLADGKYRTWVWNYGNSPKCNISRSGYFPCGYIEIRLNVEDGKITEMKVFGDFFSTRDVEDFERKFIDLDYSREEIEKVFETINITEYFGQVKPSEIMDMIY